MQNEPKLDKIFIKDLLLKLRIGINETERVKKIDILVNVEMWVDTRKASTTQNLNDTVDYSILYFQLLQLAETREFILIETLAEEIAQLALTHPLVQKVKVSVEKPGIYKLLKSAGIEIVREK